MTWSTLETNWVWGQNHTSMHRLSGPTRVLLRLSARNGTRRSIGQRTIRSHTLFASHDCMLSHINIKSYCTTTPPNDEDENETSTSNVKLVEESENAYESVEDVEVEENDMGRKLKPREVVEQLSKYIVGQPEAKRAVAIALRNRWRRLKLPAELRPEVSPKNILMIGPTGCGKTEIARRLAKLSEAPFVKVEATKFTEVGFHGRDVDQIIRDLVENAINLVKKQRKERVRKQVQHLVEKRILDALTGINAPEQQRAGFLRLLRMGEMEDRIVTFDLPQGATRGPMGNTNSFPIAFAVSSSEKAPSLEDLLSRASAVSSDSKKLESRSMTVAESRSILEEIEMEKQIDMTDVVREAIKETEENGIVFIDEIDKICSNGDFRRQADPSSEGVQRDLLPLIEGCVISTKHGNVMTDHILFISSGAFHSAKPSDLLAELQGRLPIRVELKGLTEDDLYRILTEPVTNLIKQQVELIKTEDVELQFTEEAIREVAKVAYEINNTVENIGARRLHTVLEKVVEEISFDSSEMTSGSVVTITKEFVTERVGKLMKKTDLSKFIL